MQENKALEKELRKLRRKKRMGDTLFLFGIYLFLGLLVFGMVWKIIYNLRQGRVNVPNHSVLESASNVAKGIYFGTIQGI